MSQMPPPPPPPPSGVPVPPGAGYQPGQSTPLPPGVTVTSAGKRFGGYLLQLLLIVVTLGIGYILWDLLYAWPRSQSPAKQLLKMKVVKKDSGLRAAYGTMVLRDVVGKILVMGLIGAIPFVGTLGALVLDFMLLWDKDRQELWDKIGGTIVVDDPNDVLSKDTPTG